MEKPQELSPEKIAKYEESRALSDENLIRTHKSTEIKDSEGNRTNIIPTSEKMKYLRNEVMSSEERERRQSRIRELIQEKGIEPNDIVWVQQYRNRRIGDRRRGTAIEIDDDRLKLVDTTDHNGVRQRDRTYIIGFEDIEHLILKEKDVRNRKPLRH